MAKTQTVAARYKYVYSYLLDYTDAGDTTAARGVSGSDFVTYMDSLGEVGRAAVEEVAYNNAHQGGNLVNPEGVYCTTVGGWTNVLRVIITQYNKEVKCAPKEEWGGVGATKCIEILKRVSHSVLFPH